MYKFFLAYDKPNAKANMYKLQAISALNFNDIYDDDTKDKKPVDTVNYDELSLANSDLPYLQERYIEDDTIERFEIHYDKNLRYLVVPCYNKEREDIGYVKRMIFGSRKYVNSQELATDEILYPMDKIPDEVNKVILVEGVFDAIRAHQEGYINTLSNFGGVLSNNHMKVIGEYTKRVTVCPDKDDEGIRIANMNIERLQRYGFIVDILITPGTSKDLAGVRELVNLKVVSYERMVFAGKSLKSLIRG